MSVAFNSPMWKAGPDSIDDKNVFVLYQEEINR